MSGNLKSKSKLVFLVLVFLSTATVVFPYFNIGLGYYFGNQNNFLLRVGYEQLNGANFSLYGEYIVNNGWIVFSKLGFRVSNFKVGPFIHVLHMQTNNAPDFAFGGLLDFPLTDNLEVAVGMTYKEGTPIGKLLFASLRFYVPDPPGMKMRDRLYIELGYRMESFVLIVGLLEP
uniref:Outer membrane protein beta-barrel domain-containing protein n=1 Tax=Fervidobacterium thailandense TaxID=1008305 RepID=A0A7C5RIS5_9BACT